MKNRQIYITSVLLIVTAGSYFRLFSESKIKMVDLVAILAIGALLGALIVQIIQLVKDKKK